MRNRTRQRENRRKKHHEEKLEKRNAYGNKDLTAYNAIEKIRSKDKSIIEL
ncbi:MAG: hypothetical protein SPI01_01235 [Succiniclasticum sp.]|nr:hypothetical protein [Succiniclasticum sp.]